MVVISFSRGSPHPEIEHALTGGFFTTETSENLIEWDCCLAAQSCPALCDPMDCSTSGFPVFHYLLEFAQTHVHQVGDVIQSSYPLLLPSIFSSIRVFSKESVLHIRWSKCWSFSFGISPSSEYSGLISFRINYFDLLVVQRTLKSLL